MDAWVIAGLVAYWSFAVVVFALALIGDDVERGNAVCVAAFWPLVAVIALPMILWRIPFKTARAIRADLSNRRLLREFDQWYDERQNDAGGTE